MRRFHIFEPWQVSWAALAKFPPHFGGTKKHQSRAQRAGLSYERRALKYLEELYPHTFLPSPWLVFRLKNEPYLRWCQPDGLIFNLPESRIIIVEIKLRHMAEAYTQINGIYAPVLRKLFPTFQLRQVEVVNWYDPSAAFPVPVQLLSNIDLVPSGRFGVHIWN